MPMKMNQQGSSGRLLRKSTTEKSLASLEARSKRKLVDENGMSSFGPQSTHKRPKLDATADNSQKTNVKTRRGRRPRSSRQDEQQIVKELDNQVDSTISNSNNVDDQQLSFRENEKSPSKATSISTNGATLSRNGNQSSKDSESENLKKLNCLKFTSFPNTPSPSPLLTLNISGNSSPQIIDTQELLEFLSGFEGIENKEPQNVSSENNVPGIERLEKSPSRFFECPLCYKVFIDGNVARSHLANTCPKLK